MLLSNVLVALVLVLVSQSAAQTCETFLGIPEECVPLVNGSLISSPPNANQNDSASLLRQVLAGLKAIDPTVCGPTATVFGCGNYFRPCSTSRNDATLAQTGKRVCRSLCDKLYADCGTLFVRYGGLLPPGVLPNCSDVDNNGTALYPEGAYEVVDADGTQYQEQCNPGVSLSTNASGCVSPLVFHRNEPLSCLPPCPRRYRSKHEMRVMKIVLAVLAIPMFIADICMALLIAMTPSRRRWPAFIPCFMFIGGALAIFGFLIGFFKGFDDVWCVGKEFAKQNHHIASACVAAAVFFVYGIQVFVLWWTWQAIAIFEMVMFPTFIHSQYARWQMLFAHATAWGLPLMLMIAALATESYGYSGDSPVCFFRVTATLSNHGFWYPMFGLTLLVVVLLVGTVAKLLKTGGLHALRQQWRLLVMLAYSTFTYSLFCAFKIDFMVNDNKYKTSMGDYVLCVMGGNKNCRLGAAPPFAMHMTFFVMWEITALVHGLLCGIDREFVATIKDLKRARTLGDFFRARSGSSVSTVSSPRHSDHDNVSAQSTSHVSISLAAGQNDL